MDKAGVGGHRLHLIRAYFYLRITCTYVMLCFTDACELIFAAL